MLDPWVGRSPREGHGNPLQYSCLENSTDGRAWWATVHGVAKESDMTELFQNRPDQTYGQLIYDKGGRKEWSKSGDGGSLGKGQSAGFIA